MFHRFVDFPFPLKVALGSIPHEKMPNFYAGISVYVSVSEEEGCPMPPLEAAASGRPVVATKTGALEEWIPPKYLVPQKNYIDLIPLIQEFKDDESKLKKESATFRKIAEKWDFHYIAKQYDRMFEDVRTSSSRQ